MNPMTIHKDYLTTNFSLTTKITLTIKNSSLGVLDRTLCDKVCQWLASGQCFSPGTSVSSSNKTDCHDIAEILLKETLNTINYLPQQPKGFISIEQCLCIAFNIIWNTISQVPLSQTVSENILIIFFFFFK